MKARKHTPAAGGAPRRRFLARAAAAAGLGFPALARAQGPIGLRWQSTWAAKDILHEYALDFAKKVNDMTGGDLRIEVLAAGAVEGEVDLQRLRPNAAGGMKRSGERSRQVLHQVEADAQRNDMDRLHRSP